MFEKCKPNASQKQTKCNQEEVYKIATNFKSDRQERVLQQLAKTDNFRNGERKNREPDFLEEIKMRDKNTIRPS